MIRFSLLAVFLEFHCVKNERHRKTAKLFVGIVFENRIGIRKSSLEEISIYDVVAHDARVRSGGQSVQTT